jgi:DNA-binding protein HU-beta
MTKRELVTEIARATSLTKVQALEAIDALAKVLNTGLTRDQKVIIRGLGTFKVKIRHGKRWYNPATGEFINLNDKNIVRFNPNKNLLAK